MMSPGASAPWVVLDTNVVLDWLVFGDVHASAAGQQIADGRLRWVRTAAMASELQRVLGYHALRQRGVAAKTVIDAAHSLAHELPRPVPLPFAQQLRCTDPDDQGFLDLAMAHRVPWLLSRDKAVLKLARRARAWGVEVLTPARLASLPVSG